MVKTELPEIAPELRNLLILLVDPVDDVAETMGRALTEYGFDVRRYRSAQELLSRYAPGRGELILARVEMPAIDGFSLLQAIRQMPDNVPCILTTGALSLDIGRRAAAAGVQKVLQAPGNLDSLCREASRAILLGRMAQETKAQRRRESTDEPVNFGKTEPDIKILYDPVVKSDSGEVIALEVAFATAFSRYDASRFGSNLRATIAQNFPAVQSDIKVIIPVSPFDVSSGILTLHDAPLSKHMDRIVYSVRLVPLGMPSSFEGEFARVRKYGFMTLVDGLVESGESVTGMRLRPHYIRANAHDLQAIGKDGQKRLDLLMAYCDISEVTMIAEAVDSPRDVDWVRDVGIKNMQGRYVRELHTAASTKARA